MSNQLASIGDIIPGDIIMVTAWRNGDKWAHAVEFGAEKTLDKVEEYEDGIEMGRLQMNRFLGEPLFVIKAIPPFHSVYNIRSNALDFIDLRDTNFRILDPDESKFLTEVDAMTMMTQWLLTRNSVAREIERVRTLIRGLPKTS